MYSMRGADMGFFHVRMVLLVVVGFGASTFSADAFDLRRTEAISNVNIYLPPVTQLSMNGSEREQIDLILEAPATRMLTNDIQRIASVADSISGENAEVCGRYPEFIDAIVDVNFANGSVARYIVRGKTMVSEKANECHSTPSWIYEVTEM
jgi:hypothetical protein